MMKLKKTAIISGGNRGLGKHIAKNLEKNGFNVVIIYRKNNSEAEKISKEFLKSSSVLIIKGDITNQKDIQRIITTTIKKFRRIDILINNAGIHDDSTVLKMNLNKWNKVIKTNLTGTFLLTKAVIDKMKINSYGRIINISSFVAFSGSPGASNYAASKAGIIGFTKSVAREIGKYNITANVISPGYFDEGMFYDLEEKFRKKIVQKIPMQRIGKPDEISDLISILIESPYITGQVFTIDGGLTT